MPPKRKALADVSNAQNTGVEAGKGRKKSKTSAKSPEPSAKPKSKRRAFKFSNPSTLSQKPVYENFGWPYDEKYSNRKKQDVPKKGERLTTEWIERVSDMGFPISTEGREILQKLDKECEKRNQDFHDIYIYNDWNGWGMSEVMENLLKHFNRDVFKKSTSPFKKWAYVEAFACSLITRDLMQWINNDDGEGTIEIVKMLGVMVLTSFEVLREHDLFKPDSTVKNIGIIVLLILDFLESDAVDLDNKWACEVVRLCSEAGFDLKQMLRKQVDLSKKDLVSLEAQFELKHRDEDADGGYKFWAEKADWVPKDDEKEEEDGFVERMWYRWDWEMEYKEFRKNHGGGSKYDLTKMSNRERQQYKF